MGYVPIPMSVAAPLIIEGDYARGEFIVPLCTLEGTLTLSMNRGLLAIAMAGGCRTVHLRQELSRSPAFSLPSITEIDPFLDWIGSHGDAILAAAESTTRHGRLLRVDPIPIQNWIVLDFVYDTGNAAGQNMVTVATEAACRYIQARNGFFLLPRVRIQQRQETIPAQLDDRPRALGDGRILAQPEGSRIPGCDR